MLQLAWTLMHVIGIVLGENTARNLCENCSRPASGPPSLTGSTVPSYFGDLSFDRLLLYLPIIRQQENTSPQEMYDAIRTVAFPAARRRIQRYHASLELDTQSYPMNVLLFFLKGEDRRIQCEMWLSEDEGEPFEPGYTLDLCLPPNANVPEGTGNTDELRPDPNLYAYRVPLRFELRNDPWKAIKYYFWGASAIQTHGQREKMATFVIRTGPETFPHILIPFKEDGYVLNCTEWRQYLSQYDVNRKVRNISFYENTF